MVTDVPTGPDAGLREEMAGVGVTVKFKPLLAAPLTVTTTFPVVAPVGTGATMPVLLQLVGEATTPLKVTMLVPWVAPKFAPEIVMTAPTGPDVGLKLLMLGVTVNASGLLANPPTVTITLPVVAPFGTSATILVAVQDVAIAEVPLNVTVLPA